jgi:hypothetical protein
LGSTVFESVNLEPILPV